MSPPCQVCWSYKYCGNGYMFLIYHINSSDHIFKGHVTFRVETAQSKSPSCQGSGGTLIVVRHLILQEHMIKRSSDFFGENPSW